ncbi:hypothetical protein [Pseudophaeobacter sp. EL27]|uniref:hypothetical protein n=1 Tax=Pseudophaeobacter sp. EL27 TaxID=2107580 RepID=UPI0013C53407|nr:hypothetical protein [Pseudophaeobacter sp. EL27]
MMKVLQNIDMKTYNRWFEQMPVDLQVSTAVALGNRAAKRAMLGFLTKLLAEKDGAIVALRLFRHLLFSESRGRGDLVEEVQANRAWLTGIDRKQVLSTPVSAGIRATMDAVELAKPTGDGGISPLGLAFMVHAATSKAGDSWDGAKVAKAMVWLEFQEDRGLVDNKEDLLTAPLFHELTEVYGVLWAEVSAGLSKRAGFGFWVRWLEAALKGKPLTGDWDSHWQLMQDIALIDPEDWGEGKEQDAIRVAGIIDLITQKHALRQEVARAKQALENETFNAMSLGRHRDNMPDDMPPSRIVEYRARLQELETALDEVDAALEPPIPDVEVLEEATGRLWAIWEKIKKYPVALAFVTLIGAAATGAAGQAGVRGMDWFFDQGMPQLIRGSKDIAPKPSAAPKPQQGWEKPSVDL